MEILWHWLCYVLVGWPPGLALLSAFVPLSFAGLLQCHSVLSDCLQFSSRVPIAHITTSSPDNFNSGGVLKSVGGQFKLFGCKKQVV